MKRKLLCLAFILMIIFSMSALAEDDAYCPYDPYPDNIVITPITPRGGGFPPDDF